MKHKVFYTLAIIAYVALTAIFIYVKMNLEKQLKECKGDPLRIENILLKEGFFHSYDFETINVDFENQIKDINQENYSLSELTKGETTVVLMIYAGSCNNCVEENIKYVKKLEKDTGFNVLIGIAGMKNRRFKAFVSNHKIGKIAYQIPDDYFEGFKYSPIVYFLVTEDLDTRCFYAPSDAFNELTQDYFSKIKMIYQP